jgi:hypothetical protein
MPHSSYINYFSLILSNTFVPNRKLGWQQVTKVYIVTTLRLTDACDSHIRIVDPETYKYIKHKLVVGHNHRCYSFRWEGA